MSGLGVIRVALFLWWFASLGACIYLFLFKKPRSGAIAGFMSALSLTGWFLLGSTKYGRATNAFVQKATTRIRECRALGDRPIIRSGKILVWDLDSRQTVSTNWFDIFQEMDPSPPDVPVTVFLISKESQQVGTYSISRMPGYVEWLEVYVVQFRNFNDSGTAVAMHQLRSLDPATERPVSDSPEYGSFSHPRDEYGRQVFDSESFRRGGSIDNWIDSLPTQ